MGENWPFFGFSVKPANAEHISKTVMMVVGAGNKSALSAQLKLPEMSGSSDFWVKRGDFSMSWRFFVNPASSGHILRPDTMDINAGDSTGACNSKTACNNTLFLCLLLSGGCDELAVVGHMGS